VKLFRVLEPFLFQGRGDGLEELMVVAENSNTLAALPGVMKKAEGIITLAG